MKDTVMGERFAGATGERSLAPVWRARLFSDALRRASADKVQPYDLRRTYATWMEAAEIPRTRRRIYMGHSVRDVTDLYEAHEVRRHLAEDGAKLESFIRARERETLKLEGRQA